MVSSVSWFERLSFITTKKPWWLRQESREAESLSQNLFHLSPIRLVSSKSLPLSRTPLLTLHYSSEESSQTTAAKKVHKHVRLGSKFHTQNHTGITIRIEAGNLAKQMQFEDFPYPRTLPLSSEGTKPIFIIVNSSWALVQQLRGTQRKTLCIAIGLISSPDRFVSLNFVFW